MSGDAAPVMLIVGGTGAIGGAIATMAAAAGWRVVVHGRDPARTAATPGSPDDPTVAAGIAVDAFAPGGAATIVAQASACFGRLDAVVDCITGGPPGVTGRFGDTDPAGYAALLDASVGHLQRLAHAALPWLSRHGGTLVAFASDAGRFAAPGQSIIATSRAGIIAFVRNLAVEAAKAGVRAHCICPAYVEGTPSLLRTEARIPDRIAAARARAGLGLPTARDIAPLVLFLCGPGAGRITGQVISVNGGLNA
ncbi:MAG: SDR family oxidoreductase [Sphingomonas sp.]